MKIIKVFLIFIEVNYNLLMIPSYNLLMRIHTVNLAVLRQHQKGVSLH